MPRRIISREADDTIVPEGNLPASKPEAGSDDRSDGQIFNAQTRKYETSDTGDSSKRSIPQPVAKASSTSTGEAETVDGVDVEDVSVGAELPDDNEEGVKTELGGAEPEEQVAEAPENWRTNADLKSERKRTAEYHAKVQRAEAKSALETAKLRVQAKGLLAQEKELDARIRRAKETSKPRAMVSPVGGVYASGKKTSAVETEISKPSSWLRAVQREENVSPSFVWHINK